MEEQNRVLSVIGKLYLDLVQAHDVMTQLRQQIGVLSQENKQISAANKQILDKLSYYEKDQVEKIEEEISGQEDQPETQG
jgi:regulator of replication initiation timing